MVLIALIGCAAGLATACTAPAAGSTAASTTSSPTLAPTAPAGEAGSTEPAVAAPGHGVVSHIVDGDTVDISLAGGTERVRLIGIDTPESVNRSTPIECFGPEASAHLAELIPPGTAVEVVRDAELRDRYGRLLGYVFRSEDDLFVNLAMAADGYAATLTFVPNTTFVDDFSAAVAAARERRLGLWGACPNPDKLFT